MDAGIKSRKLWFSVFAILIIFIGAILGAIWTSIGAMYVTMVGGVLGVVGAYLTGNVAHHYVNLKGQAAGASDATPEVPEPKEDPPKPPAARFSEE